MTVIMKGTLVVLVLLQLVVLNEALTKQSSTDLEKKSPKLKQKLLTCPRNPRLEEFKKALRLAAAQHSRRKRTLMFPMNCLHAALIETDKGPEDHFGLYECCEKCRESFDHCQLLGFFDMICASRAYKCLCECRERELKSGTGLALRGSTKSRASTKLIRNKVCKKKKCKRNRCCVEDVCLKLRIPKRVSLIGY